MKHPKTLFLSLMIGSVISIAAFSVPNMGKNWSAPSTWEKSNPQEPKKPVDTRPKPVQAPAKAQENKAAAAKKTEEQQKPKPNEVEKEVDKLY
jgi:hypothetical protein